VRTLEQEAHEFDVRRKAANPYRVEPWTTTHDLEGASRAYAASATVEKASQVVRDAAKDLAKDAAEVTVLVGHEVEQAIPTKALVLAGLLAAGGLWWAHRSAQRAAQIAAVAAGVK